MMAVRFKYGKISLTSKSCNHKVSHCWSGVSLLYKITLYAVSHILKKKMWVQTRSLTVTLFKKAETSRPKDALPPEPLPSLVLDGEVMRSSEKPFLFFGKTNLAQIYLCVFWFFLANCAAISVAHTLVSLRRRFIRCTLCSMTVGLVISVAQLAGNQPLSPSRILSPKHQANEGIHK